MGGATAVLLGIRDQTIDIDVKLDPEPAGVFESIARLKEQLHVSVELAAPDQFLRVGIEQVDYQSAYLVRLLRRR